MYFASILEKDDRVVKSLYCSIHAALVWYDIIATDTLMMFIASAVVAMILEMFNYSCQKEESVYAALLI